MPLLPPLLPWLALVMLIGALARPARHFISQAEEYQPERFLGGVLLFVFGLLIGLASELRGVVIAVSAIVAPVVAVVLGLVISFFRTNYAVFPFPFGIGDTPAVVHQMWLPAEAVVLSDGTVMVGYVIDSGGDWTSLLQESDRRVLRLRSDQLVQRTVCRLGPVQKSPVIPDAKDRTPDIALCASFLQGPVFGRNRQGGPVA